MCLFQKGTQLLLECSCKRCSDTCIWKFIFFFLFIYSRYKKGRLAAKAEMHRFYKQKHKYMKSKLFTNMQAIENTWKSKIYTKIKYITQANKSKNNHWAHELHKEWSRPRSLMLVCGRGYSHLFGKLRPSFLCLKSRTLPPLTGCAPLPWRKSWGGCLSLFWQSG